MPWHNVMLFRYLCISLLLRYLKGTRMAILVPLAQVMNKNQDVRLYILQKETSFIFDYCRKQSFTNKQAGELAPHLFVQSTKMVSINSILAFFFYLRRTISKPFLSSQLQPLNRMLTEAMWVLQQLLEINIRYWRLAFNFKRHQILVYLFLISTNNHEHKCLLWQ